MRVRAGQCVLQASVLADDIIRIRFSPDGRFAQDFSWAVVQTHFPGIHADLRETASEIRVSTPHLTLVLRKKPLRVLFLDHEGHILNQDDSLRGIS